MLKSTLSVCLSVCLSLSLSLSLSYLSVITYVVPIDMISHTRVIIGSIHMYRPKHQLAARNMLSFRKSVLIDTF